MKRQQHIYLGRVANVPIAIHASWLILLPLGVGKLTLSTAATFDWPLLLCWQIATILIILMALSVVLHEAGHLATAVRHRLPLKQIILYPFGGVSKFGHIPIKAAHFMHMVAAGPISSLLQAGLWAGVWLVWDVVLFLWVAQFNLVLGLLNLLPAVSLDSGRLLSLLPSRYKAGQVKTVIGMVTAVIIALGFNLAGGLAFVMGLFFLDIALLIDGTLFLSIGLLLQKPTTQAAQIHTPKQIEQLTHTPVKQLIEERPPLVQNNVTQLPYPSAVTTGHLSTDTSKPSNSLAHGRLSTPISPPSLISPTTSLVQALKLLDTPAHSHLLLVEGHQIIGTLSSTQILNHLSAQQPTQLPQNLNFYILLKPDHALPTRPMFKPSGTEKGTLWNSVS